MNHTPNSSPKKGNPYKHVSSGNSNTHTAIHFFFVNRQHIPDTCTPKEIKYNILGHIGQKNASRKIEILTKETK